MLLLLACSGPHEADPAPTEDTSPVAVVDSPMDSDGEETDPPEHTGDTRDSVPPEDTDDTGPPQDTGDEPDPEPEWAYNLCGLGRDTPRPAGDWADPVAPDYLPLLDRGDTSQSLLSDIDRYDCAPDTDESGPEVVYTFTAAHPGTFRAVLQDGAGVDIDVHLLRNPSVSNGLATGCVARAHEELEVEDLPAGTYVVVADSWSNGSTVFEGAYTLAFEWVADEAWTDVPVADGVTWSRLRTDDLNGDQTLNLLSVDPATVDLQPHDHGGCARVQDVGPSLGAFAGVNGGFYANCTPTDLLRADGATFHTSSTSGYTQRAAGWNQGGALSFAWVDSGADWTAWDNAMAGYPSLVDGGTATAEVYPGQQVWSSTDWSAHPRTALGVKGDGTLLLLTADGRTAAGDGMTTPDLAVVLEDLGAVNGFNLDGGGSTTMWVEDCWLDGVVNFPSDNGAADHDGARSVGSGLYLR